MTNSLTHIGPALSACALVASAGFVFRLPLARVRGAMGAMLSATGTFWAGERLDVPWPGGDLSIVAFTPLFQGVGLASVVLIRRPILEMPS